MHSEAHSPSPLLDAEGQPVPSLVALVDLFSLPHKNTFESLVDTTQKSWMQKGKERWDYEELYPDQKKAAFSFLVQLGCVRGSHAKHNHYDYALVLGGFTPRMKMRIEALVLEWKRGVCFQEIVLLAGARPLDPRCEEEASHFSTEGELFYSLWQEEDMPEELRKIPVTCLVASMKSTSKSLVRPDTADTVALWLKTKPSSGSCLVITSQPFIGYQDSVFRTLLPPSFTLETIGSSAPEDTALSVYLDNLTKWMYQEKIRLQGNIGL